MRHQQGVWGVIVEKTDFHDDVRSYGTEYGFNTALNLLCLYEGYKVVESMYVTDLKVVVVERARDEKA